MSSWQNMSEREQQEQLRSLRDREKLVRDDLWNASLGDLAWLAQRITQRLQKPDYDEYHSDGAIQAWMQDPNYAITLENDTVYLNILLRLLPARASIEGANIQAVTNQDLVHETQNLAKATMLLAGATIILAVVAIATLGFAIF